MVLESQICHSIGTLETLIVCCQLLRGHMACSYLSVYQLSKCVACQLDQTLAWMLFAGHCFFGPFDLNNCMR
ncbi:hypothetical protein BRADI_3g08506v3 [Brachypodium distachyon]|uniref:Uncharacterized protein n=1 Tax=Brachypodium distachyon TaxID=15368 RepID=A0A0Q3F3S6_BRADI|nr:hypothetical protein BRADI_3g08506v3 [Brachypodium distachyon]